MIDAVTVRGDVGYLGLGAVVVRCAGSPAKFSGLVCGHLEGRVERPRVFHDNADTGVQISVGTVCESEAGFYRGDRALTVDGRHG